MFSIHSDKYVLTEYYLSHPADASQHLEEENLSLPMVLCNSKRSFPEVPSLLPLTPLAQTG